MNSNSSQKPFRKFPLLLALLAIVSSGAWLLWKTNFAQPLLSSPVYSRIVFETPDGHLLGVSFPTRPQKGKPNNNTVLLRWNMQTQRLESQQPMEGQFPNVIFSPDGKKMAIRAQLSRDWIEIRDVARPSQPGIRISHPHKPFRWTPDSRQIIVFDKKTALYDAVTGALQRTLDLNRRHKDSAPISEMTFSPDGQRVAVRESTEKLPGSPGPHHMQNDDGGYVKGRLFIASWPGFKLEAELPGDLWNVCHWSKDGKRLTALAHITSGTTLLQGKIAHYDLATQQINWVDVEVPPGRKETYSNSRYDNSLMQPAFSPDGRFLASARIPRKNGWSVWDAATGQWKGDIGAFKFWEDDDNPTHGGTLFSRDSRYLLRERPAGIEFWDLTRLQR